MTTGPLCGVQIYGLDSFEKCNSKQVEMFEQDDLWHRIGEKTENDTAYNIEFFMFPKKMLEECRVANGNHTIQHKLPYTSSNIWFKHDLRVLELPHMSFFLGVIVSRMRGDDKLTSGYKINSPGCMEQDGRLKSIMAQYPCPEEISKYNPTSLDFVTSAEDEAERL